MPKPATKEPPSTTSPIGQTPSTCSGSSSPAPVHRPLPTTGGGCAPSPAVVDEEAETHRLLDTFAPSGPIVPSLCGFKNPQMVRILGIDQNAAMLTLAFREYTGNGEHCPAMVDAFTQAISMCTRRCPAEISALACDIIQYEHTLSAVALSRLAYVVSELGCRKGAQLLIAKTAEMSHAQEDTYYFSLLRFATECLTPPDVRLALDICSQMETNGVAYTTVTLRMLYTGFSRMSSPPIAAAIRCMDWLRSKAPNTLEGCLVCSFFNVLDGAVGTSAELAANYIKGFPTASMNALISTMTSVPPSMNRSGLYPEGQHVTYYLVDPLSVNLGPGVKAPPSSYLTFLYSTLRNLQARQNSVCSMNPISRRADDVTRLLKEPATIVVPYEMELRTRARLPKDTRVPQTMTERIGIFARAMLSFGDAVSSTCTCVVVTANPEFADCMKQHNVRCVSEIPPADPPTSG